MTNKKRKFKLADLAPQQHTFELEHPALGKTGVNLTVVGFDSIEFIQSSTALAKIQGAQTLDDLSATEVIERTAKLYAPLVKGWDDNEFFGCEYSPSNIVDILSDFNNQWLVKQIESTCNDNALFFKKK